MNFMLEELISVGQVVFLCLLQFGAFLVGKAIWQKNASNLPPGPWGIPIIGFVMYQIEHPHGLTKRAKEHGDVLNLNLNDGLAIELASFYTVREGIVVVHRVWIRGQYQGGLPGRFGLYILRVRFRLRSKQKQ